jgi:hypothetical protein
LKRNQSLGRAGDELEIQFEQQRLWAEGKRKLADQIALREFLLATARRGNPWTKRRSPA